MICSMEFIRVQNADSLWESPHPISLTRDTKHQDTQAQVLRLKGEQPSLVLTVQRRKGGTKPVPRAQETGWLLLLLLP